MAKRRGYGEGTVFQRKDGRWVAAIVVRRLDGTSKRTQRYARSEREAKAILREMKREAEAGLRVDLQQTKVSAFLQEYVAGAGIAGVRPRTASGYAALARNHLIPKIGHLRLGQLAPTDIQRLHAALLAEGLSPLTIRNTHRLLSKSLNAAVAWGIIHRNPCLGVRPPRPSHREIETLTSEQVRVLLLATEDHRLHALFVVALTTGMRLGELLGLKWADLDFAAATLTVRRSLQRQAGRGLVFTEPKTAKSRRTVALTHRALQALAGHRRRQAEERLRSGSSWVANDLVFCTTTGKPLDPGNVSSAYGTALVQAGLPRLRFHSTRHTCATLLMVAGTHPKYVSDLLGHSTITLTLETYSHVVPGISASIAATMDEILAAGDRLDVNLGVKTATTP